ncbi:MAG: hypothetical protein V4699_00855 [Patescibacteria group bacterium]
MENPEFLKQKYNNLHNSSEVKSATFRRQKRTGEKVPQDPTAQIQNYLDRLELILDPEHKKKRISMGDKEGTERPRSLYILRKMIMDKYVRPNKEKLAEGAAMVEERAARQMGIDMHYGAEQLAQRGEVAVKDLESSLDQWISYLSDLNEPYPMWFRYYAFRNILDLGEYDKDKQEFPNRTAGTNRLFPDIDRGALARIQDIIECAKDPSILERFRSAQKATQTPEDQLLTKEKAKAFSKLSFAKQYAESIQEAGEITPEMRAETKGKWIKYSQDSDPTALWASLQNKGTAWCTKGFATAETQLKGGDFYVYYTLDKQGEPKIPRIAIRMQEGSISEARGVADSQQNLEGNMTEIAEAKMSELPGKEKYQKISADMKQMTVIYEKSFKEDRKTKEKTYLNPALSMDELVFLYEINNSIEGFGYQKDPRIAELRAQRNLQVDLPIIFECTAEQIAYKKEDLQENIKAYIGEWTPEVLKLIPESVTHIYEKFPDKKVFLRTLETDPTIQSADKAEKAILTKGYKISSYAKDILEKTPFSKEIKKYELVSFSVSQLGFQNGAKLRDIYKKAQELGLELCPAEVGAHLRLQYEDQPNGEYLTIAMNALAGRGGGLKLFNVYRDDGKSWLGNDFDKPGLGWGGDFRFVFLRRKIS